MGSIWCWELPVGFVEAFPTFIETGYGTGEGVRWALDNKFSKIFSIDIWAAAVEQGRKTFAADPSVTIVEGDSANSLKDLLATNEGPFFLWLDAHFPGEYHNQPFGSYDEKTRMPLPRELDTILESGRRCCVLVDDLRYFDDLPWREGPVPDNYRPYSPQVRSLDFLASFFQKDYSVQIFLNDGGYALLTPLGSLQPQYVRKEN